MEVIKPSELINKNLIDLNLNAASKESAIDELVKMLSLEGVLKDADEFKREIFKREKLTTTAVGYGVAIPHAKSKVVKEPKVAFGIIRNGINYNAPDKEKVKLIFMLAVGESKNDLHLKAISNLSKLLINSEFRKKLLNATKKEEILETIKKFEN